MNVTLRIDGRPFPLRLERNGEHWAVGDRAASVVEVEPGTYSVLLGGRSFEVRIERVQEGWAVHINGRRLLLEVIDPRRLNRTAGGPHREGLQKLTAPMPGKVVRLLVGEGERVEAGQGVVVIEAMKMQNEMKAPKPGRVVSVPVREGATVTAGEILAIIE